MPSHVIPFISSHRSRLLLSLRVQAQAYSAFRRSAFSSSLALLKTCSTISQLKQLHAHIVTTNSPDTPLAAPLLATLIRAYFAFGNLAYAAIVFNGCHLTPPTFIWNLMIQGYAKLGLPKQSVRLFRKMLLLGVVVDDYTFTFAITACARLGELRAGESVHGLARKSGFEFNLFVGNALVSFYSVLADADSAQKLFDEMPHRDVVTWTGLVRGYVNSGELGTAIQLFREMPETNVVTWTVVIAGHNGHGRYNDALKYFNNMLQNAHVKPNEASLVCVLSACANLGALDQGKWVHTYIDKTLFHKSSNIYTALIDMYAKCGRIDSAKKVFKEINKKDVFMWTSMISGLGMHGHGKDALQLFNQMLSEGAKPDNITLLGVLNGCSHSGLVDEGCYIFNNMTRLWGIMPKIEHYGCFIDLLGRRGRLNEAFEVVQNMPMGPDIVIWRSLLNACRLFGNVGLGEQIVDHINQMDRRGHHGRGHTLLSNLYASVGSWEKVAIARKRMDINRVDWAPGCSWIEIEGVVHEFLAADRLHPCIKEIREKLNDVLKKISCRGGYVVNTKPVLFDLMEEEKEQAVSWHSEKLAIAFGLLRTDEGSPIRISKNLRICEDCHSAMKAISRVFRREIVVRDRSRFHAFANGSCTCVDYW